MNDQRNTWTLLEDLPDGPAHKCTIEDMQQEYMDEMLGKGWEVRLEEKVNASRAR